MSYASSMDKDSTAPAARSGTRLMECDGLMSVTEQEQLQLLCQLSCKQTAQLAHDFVQQLHQET